APPPPTPPTSPLPLHDALPIFETIPCEVPYLFADPELIALWQQRLSAYPGLKVGINWQGNPKYAGDRQRSIPLAQFEPLARVPRSEEHTSELQSRENLVCRLLL